MATVSISLSGLLQILYGTTSSELSANAASRPRRQARRISVLM
jgi:hypothetical protein